MFTLGQIDWDRDRNQALVKYDALIVCGGEVVACELEGGKALLDLGTSSYFRLNATAALIWEWLADGMTMASLVDRMLDEFDVEKDVVSRDVEAIVGAFAEAGLVTFDSESAAEGS